MSKKKNKNAEPALSDFRIYFRNLSAEEMERIYSEPGFDGIDKDNVPIRMAKETSNQADKGASDD